ncbi:MAG: hypothetical protein QXJ97_09840 [Desulfurococcaceae archaeon]
MTAKRRVLAISIDYPIYRLYKLMSRRDREIAKNIFSAYILFKFKKEPVVFRNVMITPQDASYNS